MKKLLISFFLILAACANNQVIDSQIQNAAKKQAEQSTMTPEQAITRARGKLVKAAKADLAFYTPLHFKEAQQTLEKIEDLQKERDVENLAEHNLLIITEAFKTEKIISKAFTILDTVQSTLADALAHKSVLEQLDSDTIYPSDFGSVVDDLTDLFKLIEQNKVEDARNEQASVLVSMTSLEVKTLIKQHVLPAENILDKAEDNDADDYAEITYEQAEKTIERAKSYIATNYRDREGVKNTGKEAVVAANRALTIGAESKAMVKLDEEEAEQKALEFERLLGQIAAGQDVDDIEGLSFREQAIKMAEYATQKTVKLKDSELQKVTPVVETSEPQQTQVTESNDKNVAEIDEN